jgi:hypothetical protein
MRREYGFCLSWVKFFRRLVIAEKNPVQIISKYGGIEFIIPEGDVAVGPNRIAVHQDWHLQGWQRNKVYPDFLACLHDRGNGKLRFTVLETKGLHLKGNDDTNYKRRLFELLTQHSQSALSVGELKLGLEKQNLCFDLLLEDDWVEKLSMSPSGILSG